MHNFELGGQFSTLALQQSTLQAAAARIRGLRRCLGVGRRQRSARSAFCSQIARRCVAHSNLTGWAEKLYWRREM
jgi:hypothetical protein